MRKHRVGIDDEERRIYRSRRGILFGVCRGLGNYFGIRPFWIRAFFVGLAIFTGFWPMLVVYAFAAVIMRPEPVVQPDDELEREFYDSYASSREGALKRVKHKFDSLDRRLRRLEDVVTSREYDWDRRFNSSGGR